MTQQPRWIDYIPVDDLPEDPRNPKGHADEDIDASLNRFGYTEPVLIDERTGRLVAGHGRKAGVIAKRDADEPPPEGIVVRDDGAWLVPVTRGWASTDDDHAHAYLVASNRITEKGGWIDDPLASILTELRDSDGGLDGTGFTVADLDELVASLAPPDFDPVQDDQPRLDVRAMVTCPQCGHEFQRN